MVLKFYMWHDQTTGLQNEKIQSGRESKMAASAKNRKTSDINFFCWTAGYIWLQFCMDYKWDLGVQKKVCSEIRSEWPFHFYVGPNKIHADPNI